MARIRFMKGQKIILNEREYTIESRLRNGDIQLRDVILNTYMAKPEITLVDALFDGNLRFFNDGYIQKKAAKLLSSEFSELPEKERSEAKRRYRYIAEIQTRNIRSFTAEKLEPVIKAVVKRSKDHKPPSWLTLKRWFDRYMSSGENIRSLVPLSRHVTRKRQILPGAEKVMNDVINELYMNEQRNSGNSVYEELVLRIEDENQFKEADEKIETPSRSTVYRELEKIDPYEKMSARSGRRAADLHFAPSMKGIQTTRSLQLGYMDDTKLDLFVIDENTCMPIGRPNKTTVLDHYSRMPLGFFIGFEPPSFLTASRALHHAVCPKSYVRTEYPNIKHEWKAYGIPESIIIDNHPAFVSEDFEDACFQLGTIVSYAPKKAPWYKAPLERHFRTVNMQMLHEQPGTTFSNIIDREDYDSKKNAIISFETLIEISHVYDIDIYMQRAHRGINDTPAHKWEVGIAEYPPALPYSISDLPVLLGKVEYRRVFKYGIELNNLLYNSDALALLRRNLKEGSVVKVKFDQSDLSVIHVFDEKEGIYTPVFAINQEYTRGLTLWQHQVITKHAQRKLKRRVNIAELSRAKDEIRRIVERDWQGVKKNKTKVRLARYLNKNQRDYTQENYQEPLPGETQPSNLLATVRNNAALPGRSPNAFEGVSSHGRQITKAGSSDQTDNQHEISLPESSNVPEGKKRTRSRNVTEEPSQESSSEPPVMVEDDDDDDLPVSNDFESNYNLPK